MRRKRRRIYQIHEPRAVEERKGGEERDGTAERHGRRPSPVAVKA
jgi:hypothetical protein